MIDLDRLRRWATVVASLLVTTPLPFEVLWVEPGGFEHTAIVFLSDLVVGFLVAASLPLIVAGVRRRDRLVLCLVGLWVWLAVAAVVHPFHRGPLQLLRVAGLVAVAVTVASQSDALRFGVLVTAPAALVQAALSLTQRITLGPVIGSFGEAGDPFLLFGDASAPQGTEIHPYLLAYLALVAGFVAAWFAGRTGRWPVALLSVLTVAPVGYTYGRGPLLGVLAGCAVLAGFGAVRRQVWWAIAGGAVLVGVVVAGAAFPAGWASRIETSRAALADGSATGVTTSRDVLMRQSLRILGADPVFGAGPGGYVRSLNEVTDDRLPLDNQRPVHFAPLLVTAEGGIPAGLCYGLALVVVVWRGFRRRPGGLALCVGGLALVALDHLTWSYPQGLFLTGVWFGLVSGAEAGDSVTPPR